MLDKKTLEMVKGMSREERLAYFEENKKHMCIYPTTLLSFVMYLLKNLCFLYDFSS